MPWESLIAMLPFKWSCTVNENTISPVRYANDFVVFCLFVFACMFYFRLLADPFDSLWWSEHHQFWAIAKFSGDQWYNAEGYEQKRSVLNYKTYQNVSRVHNSLRWRHYGRDGVSNHQPHHCLLNRLFACRSMKTSKLRVTGLCAGNSPGTGEFPAQMASNAENVSIWWRHHV